MQKSVDKKRWLLAILVAGIGLFVASIVTTSTLEEQDEFCTSCHRAPEVTYFDRVHTAVTNPTTTDLASFHYTDNAQFHCVDCHRGDQSLEQRAQILWLAAKDTAVHFLGSAEGAGPKRR